MQQDSILWQRFKEGDRVAFESLIRTYYQPLFEYGRKFTSDRDALKDHVHDLFTNLWERREALGQTDCIRPYLLKSLRNRIYKEKQRSDVFEEADQHDSTQFGFEEDEETRIISNELSDEKKLQIKHILSTLTRRQQEIIHLKFYQNLSNDQIAELLVISRPAVANLLYQTLKLFREKWQVLLYTFFSVLLFD
ncbi:RNA polymerase sigma factor [Dyadobacter psychrotolerans]|uniref:Sigma-70 family RNA polymerase sigma factor n=1 Tax=Dyadobacter psychrotolerans TaxID=2541721 RepID=A0A4R5E2A4_9BACT|nr:sigma-70 family RNA polymerase sigma factor [Dyadobacter psychrotolerans]TDE18183.1 sigma-70 family RNA polymerase sigma factor [Dyadobacter psychrotolerans]